MKDFVLHVPTQIFFGASHGEAFAKSIASLGKKVLLLTGGGSIERLGYLQTVEGHLKKAGLTVHRFSGIEPNPHARTINRAAGEAMKNGDELIVALGGGSVMDAAKAIAALAFIKENDIWPYVGGEPKAGQLRGAIPVVAIPTTAATASEVTPFAVISNPEVKGKSVLAHEFLKPRLAWLNPAFTTKLSVTTTRDGAADILSHVFENYLLGGNDSPLADEHTEGVIRTVVATLPLLTADPENVDYRARLLWASNIALNGYQLAGRNPSQFPLHSMEHALSGIKPDLAHGRGLATLYPAYFRWLLEHGRARDRFARLGEKIFDLDSDSEA
ncbi:MAG TPA: iron-containing alcohol dehydrogenase, partial [Opitutaceae bacterium]|nr:iron-containing alcohol dehydrogenase [Opitutaceae bacterium]